jgi:dienelactone hydrolase
MTLRLDRREFHRLAVAAAAAGYCGERLSAAERNDVPWLAEIQRPPTALPKDAPVLKPLLIDAKRQAIKTHDQWSMRRKELQQQWQSFLGREIGPPDYRPKLEVVTEDTDAGVRRQLVRYEIEPGIKNEAYLLEPLESTGKRPGVAVFHSTVNHSILQPAGLGSDPEKAFGLKLAKQGCVTISPRNFLWPDNQHIAAKEETERFQRRHPDSKGMAKMLFDARVALNILASLPGVDANRLGAVGHSLGAKEVLYLAAFDDRIQVTVSSEGGIGTSFSNWDAPWYLGPSIKDPSFVHEHHELLAMVAPRAFLLIGGDSADGDRGWPFIDAALPVYRLLTDTPRMGQYNHRKGHSVPPECEARIDEWFATYL